jgi:hypothetical protein
MEEFCPTATCPVTDVAIPEGSILVKVVSLAVVDAVNPCTLAVLTLILLAIWTLGSKKRREILLAGLVFSFSVYLMYFFYGLLMTKFFQSLQGLTQIRFWLHHALGYSAIILGLLNLKDFINYRPGGFLTEMPLFLRLKTQSLFFKVTSPKGAFGVGAFVTLFLLPCTIGPYVICAGILCSFSFFKALLWLLFYNLIFILPMLVITGFCYLGMTTAEKVQDWREEKVRYLHLIAGLIMLSLGLAMVLDWI